MIRVSTRRIVIGLTVGCLVLAYTALAPTVSAQSVTGVVIGPDQRPVAGAVVELLDASSMPVAHGVVNSNGAFTLRAGMAGRYRVRARQIGWRPVLSAMLDLRGNADERVRLAFTAMAVALDTVRVTNRSVCGLSSDSTAAVVAALEYARTALLTTDVRRVRGLTFAALRFDQLLDPVRERVVQQRTRLQTDSAAQPWQSTAIDQLRRDGYVVTTVGDTVLYRLPGLDMLASPAFVDDHCFEFNGKSDKTRIGVNFEPTPTRKKIVDIRGTLWLNRATASLTSLEFRFTNLEGAQNDAKPGGQMTFDRLRDGTWAVTQWTVRMPVLERRAPKAIGGARIGSGVPETVVANISLTGGQISAVVQSGDTLFARPGIVVSGQTIDSASNAPVAARIELLGTAVRTESDERGRFELRGVLPGEYLLAVRTASLDSVRAAATFPLSVLTSAPPSQTLKIANAAGVVALICPPLKAGPLLDRGVLTGFVSGASRDDSTGARVTIEWPADPNVVGGAMRWISTHAATDGTFRACGVPMERPITVRAWSDRGASAPASTQIAATTRFASVELTLDSTRAASGVLTGSVLSDGTNGPARAIADADVALPDLGRAARTNSDGLFHLSDLPAGPHRLTVRKLGFGPLDATITLAARERAERRIVLGAVSVLETIDVRATRLDPGMRDFEEHRTLGIGKFLTRADLDRQKTATMTDLLKSVNGVNFKSVTGRQFATGSRRAGAGRGHCYYFERVDAIECVSTNDCFMQVYIDNHPVFLGRDQETVPDLSMLRSEDLEGVEVYASGAETPSKYQGFGSTCGTVVVHRRRSR